MPERLTVRQAAQYLGVSESAIRQRIHRNTLPHEKDENGRLYILTTDLDNDDTQTVIQDDRSELIEELRDTNVFLKAQLEARSDELAEMRRIIAALTQRIPELEAAPEQRESTVSASDDTVKRDVPQESAGDEIRQSWWRRFFGVSASE
jgi:excisionase family DNA binding protein